MGSNVRTSGMRRAMAIAIAAGLAVSSVQAIETGAPFGAAVAHAAETAIPADAVEIKGLFDKNGDKVTDNFDTRSGAVDINEGYTVRLSVDVSSVEPDAAIEVFFAAHETPYYGGAIRLGTVDRTFGVPDVAENVIKVTGASDLVDGGVGATGIRITGLADAARISSGKVDISIPVGITSVEYSAGNGLTKGPTAQNQELVDKPLMYWTKSVTDKQRTTPIADPSRITISYKQHLSGYNDTDKHFQTWTQNSLIVPDDGGQATKTELYLRGYTPVNPPNGTVSVSFAPDTGHDDLKDWTFSDPKNWKPEIVGYFSIDDGTGNPKRDLKANPVTEAEKADTKIAIEPIEDGKAVRVTVSGYPADLRVIYHIRNLAEVELTKTGTYRHKAFDLDPKSQNANSPTTIGGGEGVLDAEVKIDATATVDGKVTSESDPAEVKAGVEQPFKLILNNPGNLEIDKLIIFDPDGKEVAADKIVVPEGQTVEQLLSLKGGESKEIEVLYTPKKGVKGAQRLAWTVQYSDDVKDEAEVWIVSQGCDCTVTYGGKDDVPVQDAITDMEKRLNTAETGIQQLATENEARKKDIENLTDELAKANKAIDDLKGKVAELEEQDQELQRQIDASNKRITIIENNYKDLEARLKAVETKLNTGIGKCIGTVGGSLLALIPAAALLSQMIGGSKNPVIDNAMRDMQKQLGMFNPDLARFVDQNRGAITAGLVGLGVLPLLFAPGLCGDASVGQAIVGPLSSDIEARRAEKEKPQTAQPNDAATAPVAG